MKKYLIILSLFSLLVASCKKEEDTTAAEKTEAIANYAKIVEASYEDSYNTAVTLKQKIDAFVATPTAASFDACKEAWKAARIPYGQTETYRFYDGPIEEVEGLINAWPMDENFIDYVQGNANTGLINDPTTYPTINKTVLVDLNESISETSIFTGYHAIEFLLWGQDLSATSAGLRPYTDYLSTGGTAKNQARRGQYLKAVTELLVDNLKTVLDEWRTTGKYRKELTTSTPTDTAMTRIFTGLGKLAKGELSDERMFVAVDSKDQENEHSCFSDNTHIDIQMNFQGIKNAYFGSYKKVDGSTVSGTNLSDLASKLDKTKADALAAAFTDAETKIKAIPTPFDQAILKNQDKIISAVEALRKLGDKSSDVALTLGAKF
ncbi:MAG: imelysin family protein [Saprospiraceae bacterium]|nr:imelysin family protein [Saprospiraceae bacterium]